MAWDPDYFSFADQWRLDAPPARVFAALADVDSYPRWWPQVRQVRRLGPDHGTLLARSVIPVTLTLHVTREIEDPGRGLLRIRLAGDLEGYAQFTVSPFGHGARADYLQEVRTVAGPLRVGSRLTPLTLRANHAAMMRGGQEGLRRELSRR